MEPLEAPVDSLHFNDVYNYVLKVYTTVSGTLSEFAIANKTYLSAALKGADLYTQIPQFLIDLKHASKYYYYSVQFQNHLMETKDVNMICNFTDFVELTNQLGDFIVQLAVCSYNWTVKFSDLPEDIVKTLNELKAEYVKNKKLHSHVIDCGLIYASSLNTEWYRTELSRLINRLNIHVDIISMELEYEFAGKKCLSSGRKLRKSQEREMPRRR